MNETFSKNADRMQSVYFSIVTINYNNWEGLVQTVQSVIDQEFNQFEYILVDGDSNDQSKDYIQGIQHHRIITISEKDSGIYNAMNKGIRMSSGQYIIFLNSGDSFTHSQVLQELYEFNEMNRGRLKFIYGDAIEIEKNGQRSFYKKAKSHLNYEQGMFAHHQSMVFSNHIIKKYHLFYNEDYQIAADWDFIIRFLKYTPANEIGYFKSSISNFQLGGVSGNYMKGINEQFSIRQEQLNWHPIKCSLKASRDVVLNTTRALCPWVYRAYTKYRSGMYRLNDKSPVQDKVY